MIGQAFCAESAFTIGNYRPTRFGAVEQWTRSGQPRTWKKESGGQFIPSPNAPGRWFTARCLPLSISKFPDYYVGPLPPFLQPFWKHWGWNWAFWKDGLVNATGFMPLGILLLRILLVVEADQSGDGAPAIIFGCVISFIIEATQFYLPTRDSDSMDFINNTLGTVLGALYTTASVRARYAGAIRNCSSRDSHAAPCPLTFC
jgi:hypothetical protein